MSRTVRHSSRNYSRGAGFLLPACWCDQVNPLVGTFKSTEAPEGLSASSFTFLSQGTVSFLSPQADEKAVDGGLLPDANGKDPNPGGQTEGSKWQKPRLSRKSLMKCCLVKWIIASTTQQGPGTGT